MTENQFEQFFKDRLDQYASPVNSEVLDRVFREKASRKKKPAGKWWLLPLILLVAGGSVFIYLESARLDEASHIPVAGAGISDDSESAGLQDLKPSDAAINPENKVNKLTTGKEDRLSNPDAADHHGTDIKNNDETAPPAFALPGKLNDNKDTYPYPHLQSKNLADGNSRTGNPGNNSNLNSLGSTIRERSNVDEISRGYNAYSALRNQFNLASIDGSQLSWSDQFDLYNQSRGLQASRGNHFPFCVPECNIPGCPNFRGPRRNDWYLEAFGSFDLPSKRLEDHSTKSGFIQAKDSTETMLPSYSAGFRITKNITNSWLIKTGVHYSRINERFDYRNENERRLTTIITIRTIIRGPGDTLIVTDTSFVEQMGTRIKRTYNSYRNIDIPLILSYEIRSPSFTVGVQGGLLFNIRSWYSGDMLDTSMVPMSETARNPKAQFKTNMGVGVYAGVSFIKPITETLDLFAEPWYRKYLQNHAVSGAAFRQNISSWGLQLGVRYKINAGGQRDY